MPPNCARYKLLPPSKKLKHSLKFFTEELHKILIVLAMLNYISIVLKLILIQWILLPCVTRNKLNRVNIAHNLLLQTSKLNNEPEFSHIASTYTNMEMQSKQMQKTLRKQ